VYVVHAGYIYSNVPQLPSRTLLQCHHRSSSSTCAVVTSSMAEIWLGLAGDLCSPEYPCDHYTTRVGGAPVFPGSAVPWGSRPPKCQVCGSPLSMVLQVGCHAVTFTAFLSAQQGHSTYNACIDDAADGMQAGCQAGRLCSSCGAVIVGIPGSCSAL
jgi:hypothetical protein